MLMLILLPGKLLGSGQGSPLNLQLMLELKMGWLVRKMPDRLCCFCGAAELPHRSLPPMQGMREAQKSSESSERVGITLVTPTGWETGIGEITPREEVGNSL